MMQGNEQEQRGQQDRETDHNKEEAGGPDEFRPEPDSLFLSVRDFLKQEEQTYGQFQVPELSDIPQKTRSAETSAAPTPSSGATAADASTAGTPSSGATATDASTAGTPSSGATAADASTVGTPSAGATEADASTAGTPSSGATEADASTAGTPSSGATAADASAARTLEELFEICLTAEVLRTDLADTRLVFGTGNPNADLMLIGEAPGLQEDRQGEPFVGKAGQLLNKILAAISFRREDVYIANILKHRPPNNRDPLPEERDRSLPYLYRQIELIQPKLILCLGRISAQTLLKTPEPMKNLRSRFHPFHNGIELLVTFHPAALLRNPAWKRDTWEDVQLLRKRYDELTGSGL